MTFFQTKTELKEWLNRFEFNGKSFRFIANGVDEVEGELSYGEHEELVQAIFLWKKVQGDSFVYDSSAVLDVDGYEYSIEYSEFNQQFTVNG
jgi:hypothetical protein